MIHFLRLASAASLAVLVSGCSAPEPFERPYTWRPVGANQSNLAVMVEDPIDLTHGRRLDPTDGASAAAAIARLRRDRVKPLREGSSLSSAASDGATAPATN